MTDRARDIFRTAREYSESAKLLNQSGKLVPSHVLAALALELYFKSIYFAQHGKDFKENGRHSHNYSVLFKELDVTARKAIEDKFVQLLSDHSVSDIKTMEDFTKMKIDRNFEKVVENWSGIFVGVRYFYDMGRDAQMVFFPEIEGAIHDYVSTHHRSWLD